MRPVAALPEADAEAESGCGAGFQRAVLGLLRLRHGVGIGPVSASVTAKIYGLGTIEPMEINYGKTNGKYIELYGNRHNEDGGTPENETAD